MTENVKTVETESTEVPVVVELTPLEQKASADGWKPKEQFVADGGSEEEWRPAKEFVDRGELFQKIDELKKEVRSTKKNYTTLRNHYDKVRETEYKRALESLQKDKKTALEEGDAQAVVDIDEKIISTREAIKEVEVEAQRQVDTPEPHPDFQRWVDRNKWYTSNSEMREFADSIGISFKKTNLSSTPQEVLDYVEKRIIKAYPENFKNPKKSAVSAVESSVPVRKSTSSIEMNDEETRVMRRLVSQGVLTEEQYKKDLKAIKEKK